MPAPAPNNVADWLTATARSQPNDIAVAMLDRRRRSAARKYIQVAFGELEQDVDRISRGLVASGVEPGTRIVLFVRPGVDFIALTFSLFRCGATAILIDPGMGRRHVLRCLDEVRPEGFVAIPMVHALRVLSGRRFERSIHNVTVGRRWFWRGYNLDQLRELGQRTACTLPTIAPQHPAAIIFTSGSTGPAKGVLYSHQNFNAQVTQIRDFYGILPGEIDLPCFPLFGLFNCAMGVTTVVPDMDPSHPARVDPARIVAAMEDWKITQSFGSPAVWNRVGKYLEDRKLRLPWLRRVLSAGAPVPGTVLQRMKRAIHVAGEIHTPYGATEALPVASISAHEVLQETSHDTVRGAGVCVGRAFSGIDWKVIRIVPGPIDHIDDVEELDAGEIGELIVRGPVVTREYVTRVEANSMAKIESSSGIWHRMGDVGYMDGTRRFWFCGREAHRVHMTTGTIDPVRCEAIFNQHPHIYRSALVGVGSEGDECPVLIAEPGPGHWPRTASGRDRLARELLELGRMQPLTAPIRHFEFHSALPVDIRHNAKIFRERLRPWAEKRMRKRNRKRMTNEKKWKGGSGK